MRIAWHKEYYRQEKTRPADDVESVKENSVLAHETMGVALLM